MIVNIKYVNPPKPGGKYGNIKMADGTMIMVPPDLVTQFQAGTTVEVATKQQTWNQGTDQERLVTIATSGPAGAQYQPPQGQGVQQGYQGASQQRPAYRSNTGFQPRVVQGGLPDRPTPQDRLIFITGVVGRAMGSGKFTASEIRVLADEASLVFDRLTGPSRPVAPPRPAAMETYASHEALPPEPGDPGPELQ